jgi:hypothetical protein
MYFGLLSDATKCLKVIRIPPGVLETYYIFGYSPHLSPIVRSTNYYSVTHTAAEPPDSPSVPYLKEGVHGRRGDFQAVDDRHTGLGHQIEPDDQLKLNGFKNFRSRLYEQFPHYPHTAKGVSVGSETKSAWDQWQRRYAKFGEKYPGYALSHLWPCGCEKVSDKDESEEE